MAVSAVLDLPELLESILVNLDMKTLLLSQRVSKQWQATINRSPNLQDSLFFKLKDHRGKDGVDAINTLLMLRVGRAPMREPSSGPPFDELDDSMERLFAFDISKLPAHASAFKMTLSWCEKERCPSVGTEFMVCADFSHYPVKQHGWIVAVGDWFWEGCGFERWEGRRTKGIIYREDLEDSENSDDSEGWRNTIQSELGSSVKKVPT